MLQSKKDIEAELQAYKEANPDWMRNLEKGKIVASYNIRLASFQAAAPSGWRDFFAGFFCGLRELWSPPLQALSSHVSVDYSPGVFPLAVKNMDSSTGIELSGNCVAVGPRSVVTAFHNIYDKYDFDCCQDLYEKDLNFQSVRDGETNCLIGVFKFAVIAKSVVKHDDETGSELFESAILLRFREGVFKDDWALLDIVYGVDSFCGISVAPEPEPLAFLTICPESALPKPGLGELKGYHFDLATYKESEEVEEVLLCQRIEYSRVTLLKRSSHLHRLRGGLNKGSCGSPTVNAAGQVVGIHLWSIDGTHQKTSKTRFRMIVKSEAKRPRLVARNLKVLTSEMEGHRQVLYGEQAQVSQEMLTVDGANCVYKESFVLCKSARLMELVHSVLTE
eukprot:gene34306-41521_t